MEPEGECGSTILAVGDSLTEDIYRCTRLEHDPLELWPMRLQQRLIEESPQYHHCPTRVLNIGVGSTTAQVDGKCGGDNPPAANKCGYSTACCSREKLEAALRSHIDIVIIMFGTNDAKKVNWNRTNYVADYTALVRRFVQMEGPVPRVIVMSPPPAWKAPQAWDGGDYGIMKDVINSELAQDSRRVAAAAGAEFADLHAAMGERVSSLQGGPGALYSDVTCDGIHFTPLGSRLMAHVVYELLSPTLLEPSRGAATRTTVESEVDANSQSQFATSPALKMCLAPTSCFAPRSRQAFASN
jgi:lysophospholipase L1-like esterase